jgi:GNAT superfamily N-acetyltransferase
VGADTGFELVWLERGDLRLSNAAELRYQVLYEPFGVARSEMWDQDEPGIHHLLALDGDRVLGYGCLVERGGEGQVRQLAVEPAARRGGVGGALLDELVAAAARRGIERVWSNVRVPFVGFYERAGFEACGGTFRYGATGLPHVRMERPLP